MPRTVSDYSQSIIYKLCCNNPSITEIYVGSTTNFRNRKNAHKGNCQNINSNAHNLNVYQFIRANGNWENWNMIQIEQYNAADKRTLHTRERYWIETLGASLNSNTPSRTLQEYNDDILVIDKKKKYFTIYYQSNKTKANAYMKEYHKINSESLKIKKKNYRQHNKNVISQKATENWKNNKEKLKVQKMKKNDCECGGKFTNAGKSGHMKTIKHQTYQQLFDFIHS